MAFFLCIETSQQNASVALMRNGICIGEECNPMQKEHAAFIQPAIARLLSSAGASLHDLDAVSVSMGPGSYTGLRVGMASAKGICFAIQKPLITLHTLAVMAYAAKEQLTKDQVSFGYLAPMIEARRNEVFTAVYDENIKGLMLPQALILHDQAYHEFSDRDIFFFGEGAVKWRTQCKMERSFFADITIAASDMNGLTEAAFAAADFASIPAAVPFYGKEFYSTAGRN